MKTDECYDARILKDVGKTYLFVLIQYQYVIKIKKNNYSEIFYNEV